jgi:hypothetical protein
MAAKYHALKGARGWYVLREVEFIVKGVKKIEALALAAALNEQERRKDQ